MGAEIDTSKKCKNVSDIVYETTSLFDHIFSFCSPK